MGLAEPGGSGVMGWPNSTSYFEAIQNPALCFQDPELRGGEAAANPMGLPILYAGNFAAVFQIVCPRNQRWAVKCFTREVPGLHKRYQAVSAHLCKARLPFMVDFQYLEQGIKLGERWYAVLKMRWVEGLALNELAADSLDKLYVLTRLSKLWVQLAALMRRGGVAHGDLQHGNVLLVPGSKEGNVLLRLIDYDGMFVPALAASKPGEKGHPNYQHPQRLKEGTYHAEIDRFSHLAIYTALRCLTVAGKSLWKTYDNSENLLFKEEDFRDPGRSELFRELWQLRDPEAHALVGRLALACRKPLEQTPLLEEVVIRDEVRPLTAAERGQAADLLGAERGEETMCPDGAATWIGKGLPAGRLALWRVLWRERWSRHRRRLVWAVAGSAALLLLLLGTLLISSLAGGGGTTPQAVKDIPPIQEVQRPETVWVDDALPAGVKPDGDWTWVAANPAPFSGKLVHQSKVGAGQHQHYFTGAPAFPVNPGDSLFTYVYLDPANVPAQVMLQWNDGDWGHRAYWGENKIGWGKPGTPSLWHMGALPAVGRWVRLEAPAKLVGLEGRVLNGMAFTLFGGRAAWDRAGKIGAKPPAKSP